MSLMNNYRKGWALRYLREAKAELAAAQNIPYMGSSMILEAMKKAQVAVYYSLGDPKSVEGVVYQTILKKNAQDEPVLRCLVEIERMVQQIAMASELDREKTLEHACEVVQIASDIVKLFVGRKVD
jgi:hypothetical protein